MEKKIRKPVAAFITDREGALSVVCDDGTSWRWYWRCDEKAWIPWVPPIPGTKAAIEEVNENF